MLPISHTDRKIKLLFVDDSKPLCMLYSRMAQEVEGVQTTAMESPVRALQWARDERPDLVVVDYLMPEMDGLCFLAELAKFTTGWSVKPSTLMITAVDEMDVRLAALKLGVLDFIAKPLQDVEFVTRLRNLSAAHRNLVYLKARDREFAELQVVQENALEGIARLDANDHCTWANQVYAKLVGRPVEALIGATQFEALHGEDKEKYVTAYGLMRNCGSSGTSLQLLRLDGSRAVVEISLVALPKRDGEYAGHMRFVRDISEQHQAAELMRQSQERLRHALDATQDGLWDWDIAGGSIYYSDRWMGMLGYQQGEWPASSSTWEALCHPDDWPMAQRRMARHLSGQQALYEYEHRLRHKDGHWVWVLGRGRVVERLANGEPVRMVGTNIDITARRAQEALLKQSEERWQFAIEGSGDGIWDWNIQDNTVFFSPRWKSMLGYEPGDIEDSFASWRRLVHPEDLEKASERLARYLSGESKDYVLEFRLLCKNGEYRWILERGMIMARDADGRPLRMIGTHNDIHERRLVEQAVQDSEARFRDMAENFPGVIYQICLSREGGQGRFMFSYVSPRMASLFDLPWELLMAQPELFSSRIHPDDVGRYEETLRSAFLGGKSWSFQGRYLHPDGRQIWFESAARPSANLDFPAFNGVLLDITTRKQLERVKDEFVSTVSHELRTPLTSILGSLKLVTALSAAALPAQVAELLALAQRNADRLLALINDLLDMAKIESGALSINLSRIAPDVLLKEAVAVNEGYAAKLSVTLQCTLPPACPAVLADQARSMQVLSNLISNACKFSAAGATVAVSLAVEGDRVRFSVLNHGAGIAEEFRSRIFQKFSQGDSSDTRKIGGTGLGLSICKALVERMGGEIGFDSEPQVQTTFWFTLPTTD